MEPITTPPCDNCTENEDAFEQRFSTRSLRILKLITPFFPVAVQPSIALMIRMQELLLLLRRKKHSPVSQTDPPVFSEDLWNQLLSRITPLLLPEERSMVDKIRQMFQLIDTYKQLEPYLSAFSQMNDMSGDDTGIFPDALMGMLSPDLMQNLGPLMQAFASGSNECRDECSHASEDAEK